jgi:hypothetical protein
MSGWKNILAAAITKNNLHDVVPTCPALPLKTATFISEKKDRIALITVLLLSIGLSIFYLSYRQDSLLNGVYFFRDEAHVLMTADALLHGATLNKDIFWHYGLIPIYFYTGIAAIFGNSALTYLGSLVPIFILNIGLAYGILRKHLGFILTLITMAVVVLPGFLRMVAGGRIYVSFEMAALLSIALAWRAPPMRCVGFAVSIGSIFGVMQGIKFGGAFFAGAALILTDGLYLWINRATLSDLIAIAKNYAIILATFLFVELLWIGWAYRTLPAPIAFDTLFPLYHLEAYASYKSFEGTSAQFETIGIFLGTQLPALVCLISFFLVMFKVLASRSSKSGAQNSTPYAHVYLALFFLVGWTFYFQQKWTVLQYVWLLYIPFGAGLQYCNRTGKIFLILLILPSTLIFPYKLFFQKQHRERVVLPNQQALWLEPVEKKRAEKIFAVLKTISDQGNNPAETRDAVLFNYMGSGFHFYGNLPHAGRHTFFLRGFLRPYEEDAIFAGLAQTKAIVIFTSKEIISGMSNDEPASWKAEVWSPFSQNKDDALRRLLMPPIKIDDRYVIFPLKVDR